MNITKSSYNAYPQKKLKLGGSIASKSTTSVRSKKTSIKGPILVGLIVLIVLLIVLSLAIAMLHRRHAWRRKREKGANPKNVIEEPAGRREVA